MRTLILASVFALVATTVFAQGPPKFFQDTYPEHALKSALEARGVLEGEEAQLDAKTRERIALALAIGGILGRNLLQNVLEFRN